MLIGIGYRARAGKDTAADWLVREHGFAKAAFADSLKAAAREIFGWDDRHLYGQLKEVTDPYWGFSPRWALQRLGTEGVRDVIGQDTWVKSLMRRLDRLGPRVVIVDVRFPDEARAISAAGGRVWQVTRPGLPEASHASELAMAGYRDWDLVIGNDASLDDLYVNLDIALQAEMPWLCRRL